MTARAAARPKAVPVDTSRSDRNRWSRLTVGWSHRTPFRDAVTEAAAARMGLVLMLASLGTVFGAMIVAVVAVRLLDAAPERWRPAEGSGLPWELLLSTAILCVGSVTAEKARRAVAQGDAARASRWLRSTTATGVLFMLSQVWCWIRLLDLGLPPTTSLFGWIFTVLTVLHALHVMVGLAILGLVTLRAEAGRYTPSHRGGVDGIAIYWHFLLVVWITLLITLWAIR